MTMFIPSRRHRVIREPLARPGSVGLLLVLVLCGAAWAADRPNVILCMADDQGWGDVGYNGHPEIKTPTLDAMAVSCLRFDRFYAAAPVCSPTRGSVLTGRHPNRFGCFAWGHTLRPQEVTLAEALKRTGYTTGHFGKWHLGSVRADSPVSPGGSGFDRWLSAPNFYENDPLMSLNGKVVQTQGESSEVPVRAALKFIRDAVRDDKPFLAVIWFGSPHTPHIATERNKAPYKHLPEKLQNYLGEITGIDRAMGLLRRELRKIGVADNTLLWYTSDNGARKPGSTGGLRGQKGSLWEGGLRVPAIIEWPATIKAPRRVSTPCGTVDMYPTVMDMLGLKVAKSHPLDGVSLRPVIEGKAMPQRKPLGFWEFPTKGRPRRSHELLKAIAAEQRGGPPAPIEDADLDAAKITEHYPTDERPGHAAWLDGDFKLHRFPRKGDKVSYELYDLSKDPTEKKNVLDEHPDRAKRMKAGLEAWQASVIRSVNGADYAGR